MFLSCSGEYRSWAFYSHKGDLVNSCCGDEGGFVNQHAFYQVPMNTAAPQTLIWVDFTCRAWRKSMVPHSGFSFHPTPYWAPAVSLKHTPLWSLCCGCLLPHSSPLSLFHLVISMCWGRCWTSRDKRCVACPQSSSNLACGGRVQKFMHKRKTR